MTIFNFLWIALRTAAAIVITHIEERRWTIRLSDNDLVRVVEACALAGQPTLRTELFMRVPWGFDKGNLGWHLKNSRKQFRAYDGFVVAIDEFGRAWMGRLTPMVIMSLRVSDYRENTYFYVPICGRRQSMHGQPFTADGMTLDVYPYFFHGVCQHDECAEERAEWVVIERRYREAYEGQQGDWRFMLDSLYPKDLRLLQEAA